MDARCDIYAVGALLFEMFAERRPFEGTTRELLREKLVRDAPLLSEVAKGRTIPKELDAALARALARKVEDRFETAAELAKALRAVPIPVESAAPRPPDPDTATTIPDEAPSPGVMTPSSPTKKHDTRRRTPKVGAKERGRGIPLPLLLALPALLIVGLFGGLGYVLLSDDRPDPVGGSSGTIRDPEEGIEFTLEETTLAVPNPWEAGVPDELEDIRESLAEGEEVSREQLQSLRGYARAHPDDPRPHLLTAHVYAARGWRSDAVERYELAYRVDPGARGDPRMLANLVAASAHPAVGARAARAVRRIYGEEARNAVTAALTSPSLKRAGAARLERLRDSLSQ